MSKVSEIGYSRNRKAIENAYDNYVNKEQGSEGKLLQAVLKFAEAKLTSTLYNEDEVAETSEDYAQDVAVKIWAKLPDFVGDAHGFYSWVSRICYTQGVDAIKESSKETSSKVPLFTEADDESGLLEDNPLLNRSDVGTEYIRPIPDCIQGVDRRICAYIRDGRSYDRIGELLNMTGNAVKQRVKKMKKKVDEEKNAKS